MDNIVDETTFSQLLEIDDLDFAKTIVEEFFQQAKELIPRLDSLFAEKDWDALKKLGHHLKGSSAAVGAANIRDICDSIQHFDMFTKDRDPTVYLRRKVDSLKKAIPIAEEALSARLAQVASG